MHANGLPDQLVEFLNYDREAEKSRLTGVMDLSALNFIHPTFLLPTLVHIRRNIQPDKVIEPRNSQAASYFQLIRNCPVGYMGGKRLYIPVVSLPNKYKEFDPVFQRICELGGDYSGKEKFRVMVEEFTDNIYQHSEFENAMVMAQKYPRAGYMEFCLMDDGITINGSFRRAGMIMNDYEALAQAVEGLSSKDEPGRGFGLGGTIQSITTEFNASVLLISGQAVLHFERRLQKGFMLRDSSKLHGTLISIRMPIDGEEDVG